MNTDVDLAIAYIEECRQIHVDWAEWQNANPDWQDRVKPTSPGEPEHHLEWVEKYDHVLSVLKPLIKCVHGNKADLSGWRFCCDWEP